MKKLFVGAVAIFFCLNALAQKNNYQVAAVAFYNLENLFDCIDDTTNKGDDEFTPTGTYHYTEEIYKQKLHNLAMVISQLGIELTPDGSAIIGHAEVENERVLQDLVSQPELKSRNYKIVHFESPDSRGIDVGLLYNPKYFRVIVAYALPVNLHDEKGEKLTTRDVLYVKGILLGDTVNVFVNHWPSRRGGERASAPRRDAAATVNKLYINSILEKNPNAKILVMGDLNDDPVNQSVEKVLGAKGDIKELTQSDLYNPFMSFYKQGIGTLAYNDKWNLFDQIILSDGFVKSDKNHWTYYKAEVFNREFLKEKSGQYKGYPHRSFSGNAWINGYSDHFPTIVYLIKDAK